MAFNCIPAAQPSGSRSFAWCVSIFCMLPRKLPAASSFALGVSHEPQALPVVGSADARSRHTDRPAGVIFAFQVSLNRVEPAVINRCFNLLSKDDWRAALADEIEPVGPEVAVVGGAKSSAGGAKGLARATTCPNRSVIGPSGESEGVAPDADSGEKMTLNISSKVFNSDISNAPFVYVAGRDMPGFNQVPKPLRGKGVYFVVVSSHWSTSSFVHRTT